MNLWNLTSKSVAFFIERFVRHKKRGTSYAVLGLGTLQLEPGTVLKDMDQLTVYVGNTGDIWLRPPSEMQDGRFEDLEPTTITASQAD